MVYMNKVSGEYYVFDKAGKWQNLEHPLLSLKERFLEHNWMHTFVNPMCCGNGGNITPLY